MPRVRQHVNPLKSDFLEIPDVPRIEAAPGQRLEVELGSAEGHFLFERAETSVDSLIVGVEIRREVAVAADEEARRLGLRNVRSVFANMSLDLARLFAPGSVSVFHVNFPDPWFKSRQKKRRVMGPELFRAIHPLLVPGGSVSIMTDIFDLAMDAMASLEEEDALFVNAGEPWRFQTRPFVPERSRRERQCGDEGTRIWRLLYRRRGT